MCGIAFGVTQDLVSNGRQDPHRRESALCHSARGRTTHRTSDSRWLDTRLHCIDDHRLHRVLRLFAVFAMSLDLAEGRKSTLSDLLPFRPVSMARERLIEKWTGEKEPVTPPVEDAIDSEEPVSLMFRIDAPFSVRSDHPFLPAIREGTARSENPGQFEKQHHIRCRDAQH